MRSSLRLLIEHVRLSWSTSLSARTILLEFLYIVLSANVSGRSIAHGVNAMSVLRRITYFDTILRYETNRLRNIVWLFGHLFADYATSRAVLQVIKMNEDDTTSPSRVFVKLIMQEVTESMGLPTIKERFADAEIKALCSGM